MKATFSLLYKTPLRDCRRYLRPQLSTVSPVSTLPESALQLLRNGHKKNNIGENIIGKVGKNLHLTQNHPLNIIKKKIETYCNSHAATNGQCTFQIYDNLLPIVSTKSCFDDLRVGPEHISRSPSDTYYVDDNTVLRTHTSAHQTHFIAQGTEAFLCSGDVYRRDEIDASHYPVFHQMEGVRIFPHSLPIFQGKTQEEKLLIIEQDLKQILTGLARHLFGDVEMRWNSEFFPFTHPSFELEVLFQNEWLEVLGCGVVHPEVMANSGRPDEIGWAFGLGLERLAMVLFGIPDIRLFWSADPRFITQFKDNQVTKFVSYSKYPMCYKDVSFWVPKPVEGERAFHVNDVYELIRTIAGDLVEKVELFDEFTNKKTGRHSQAYRIIYRHMDRSLTNQEVDDIQWQVRDELVKQLKVELR